MHIKKKEKKTKNKATKVERERYNKMGLEINEIENKDAIEKDNTVKACLFIYF